MRGTACQVRKLRLHVRQACESPALTVCTNTLLPCVPQEEQKEKRAFEQWLHALRHQRHQKVLATPGSNCRRRKRCSPTSHVAISSKDVSRELSTARAVPPSSTVAVSSSELQEMSPCVTIAVGFSLH